MKIYTLYYKDTGLYNRSIFVMPNDETAKKAMKLNLMEQNAERFRNEVKDGSVELVSLVQFSEETGIFIDNVYTGKLEIICNLKDLLDDNTGNTTTDKRCDS